MKTFLTEDRPGWAGPNIDADTMSAAEGIAEDWIVKRLVPPTLRVIGELIEEIDLGELANG